MRIDRLKWNPKLVSRLLRLSAIQAFVTKVSQTHISLSVKTMSSADLYQSVGKRRSCNRLLGNTST